jgi:hypothetical protein
MIPKVPNQSRYEPPPFDVRLRWMELDKPHELPASARVEVSELLPQALIAISVDVPEEWGFTNGSIDCVVRINPSASRSDGRAHMSFDLWQKIEDQPWNDEFGWGDSRLDVREGDTGESNPLDDLSDALDEADAQKVFTSFARLTGGNIEIVQAAGTSP